MRTTPAACAVDLGVRTFATVYSPQYEEVTEWGSGGMSDIYKMCLRADRMLARMAAVNHAGRQRLRKRLTAAKEKIRNKVADLHWKCGNYLVENFDFVLYPPFQAPPADVSSETAREMLTWSHGDFQQRLQRIAVRKRGGLCRVVLCTEEFTSKTCSCCGYVHSKLGDSKVFQCPSCHYKVDRDWNAARGIYLKNEHLLASCCGGPR